MGRMSLSLAETSKRIRRRIIDMAHRSKGPHVGSSLSCADILAVLYFGVLRLDPWEDRDIFVLSKAHASMALYGALAERGIVDEALLAGYNVDGGTLPAHLDRGTCKGVEASAGSLGHGFNIGLGIAHGLKRRGTRRKVYALLGDGESQEGAIWEGALFASKLGLDNFTAVVDCNNLQGYGRAGEICAFEPFRTKWEAFGWHASEVDGHDHEALRRALADSREGVPHVVVARTVKGRGVSFMEDQLIWHYYVVTDDHRRLALEELR